MGARRAVREPDENGPFRAVRRGASLAGGERWYGARAAGAGRMRSAAGRPADGAESRAPVPAQGPRTRPGAQPSRCGTWGRTGPWAYGPWGVWPWGVRALGRTARRGAVRRRGGPDRTGAPPGRGAEDGRVTAPPVGVPTRAVRPSGLRWAASRRLRDGASVDPGPGMGTGGDAATGRPVPAAVSGGDGGRRQGVSGRRTGRQKPADWRGSDRNPGVRETEKEVKVLVRRGTAWPVGARRGSPRAPC